MADISPDWPVIIDDSGPGQDGTIVNRPNVWDVIKAAINAQVYSALFPTLKPKDTIEEVGAARGTLASLAARLGVSFNDDGTLKQQSNLAALADVQAAIGHGNWVYNDDLLIWAAGDAATPTGYILSGAGASVARTGVGLGDTSTKVGPFSMKVTRAGADVYALQYIMNPSSFAARGEYFKGRKFGFGAWAKSALPGTTRMAFYDGATLTYSGYHAGDGQWSWLSGVHTVSQNATLLGPMCRVDNSAGSGYFSGLTALPGPIAPAAWIPCPKALGAIVFKRAGTLAVQAAFDWFWPGLPFIVQYVKVAMLTPPTGQALIVDVKHPNGTMFTTPGRPQCASGVNNGGAVPDGTYRNRCFSGTVGTGTTDGYLVVDIAQVGSGTPGADITIHVRAIQYNRPQQSLLDADSF